MRPAAAASDAFYFTLFLQKNIFAVAVGAGAPTLQPSGRVLCIFFSLPCNRAGVGNAHRVFRGGKRLQKPFGRSTGEHKIVEHNLHLYKYFGIYSVNWSQSEQLLRIYVRYFFALSVGKRKALDKLAVIRGILYRIIGAEHNAVDPVGIYKRHCLFDAHA